MKRGPSATTRIAVLALIIAVGNVALWVQSNYYNSENARRIESASQSNERAASDALKAAVLNHDSKEIDREIEDAGRPLGPSRNQSEAVL